MKVFKLIVNLDDETGLTFNALVDQPAHNKAVMAFNKQSQSYLAFDDNKQMITGIAISANQLIERNSPEMGRYYVYFEPKEVEKMILKMSRQQLLSSVNLMHDGKQKVEGITFMEGYFVTKTNRPSTGLDNQNIQNGSYVMTYFVEDKKLYKEIQNGKYLGYSIEGLFEQIPIKINTNQKLKTMTKKKSLFQMVFGEEVEQTFKEMECKDGTILTYDGELAVGTAMFVTVEDKKVAAPAGKMECKDGMVLTIDGDGLVSEITPAEEEADMAAEVKVEDVVAAMAKINKDLKESFAALTKENKAITERLTAFEKSLIPTSQKFERAEGQKTWKDISPKSK